MKPENTLENKAKFFAIYWRQATLTDGFNRQDVNEISFPKYLEMDQYYLLLRSLSSITDEDAIEVAKILIDENIIEFEKRYFDSYRFCEVFKFGKFYLQFDTIGDCDFRITMDKEKPVDISFQLVSEAIDFLRSRGYLVGWMGLTPDEIISRGWVKIKEA